MEIEKVIYNMLTESTGTHMLDSGGGSNRHWQRNQLKSIDDFKNEPHITIEDKDTEYPYAEISVFHHLVNSLEYLENETNDLIEWISKDPYSYRDNPDGRCISSMDTIEQYMAKNYGNDDINLVHCTNTYNYDCSLSQKLQVISVGDTYDCDVIALSIHNGADVRGGYTDYKLFEINCESFNCFYMDKYQIEEHLEYLKAG
tara:strand:+ start:777 stop:1379 length:603 start_codon:yes stop_codon:yes gene_type:complete